MTVFYLMTGDEFPDGLRCIDCNREILPGQMYFSRPDGVFGDGYLCEEIVCIWCAPAN